DVAALAVPGEVQIAGGEQRVRLDRQLVPLLRLLADGQKPDNRILDTEHLLGEDGPHGRELDEMLGPRVRVRAGVDEDGGPALGRNGNRDRRSQDAGNSAQLE